MNTQSRRGGSPQAPWKISGLAAALSEVLLNVPANGQWSYGIFHHGRNLASYLYLRESPIPI